MRRAESLKQLAVTAAVLVLGCSGAFTAPSPRVRAQRPTRIQLVRTRASGVPVPQSLERQIVTSAAPQDAEDATQQAATVQSHVATQLDRIDDAPAFGAVGPQQQCRGLTRSARPPPPPKRNYEKFQLHFT